MFTIKILGKEIASFGRNAENPNYPLTSATLADLLGAAGTDSGIDISEETATNFSAVYSAVRVIAESVAVLPLQIFKRTNKGRDLLRDHPLYRLLHDEPNKYQTSYVHRETQTAFQCLWGNSYAKIIRDSLQRPAELDPIHPSLVYVNHDEKTNKLFYVINGKEIIEQTDMIHIPALSFDGIKGKSPVKVAKESIGLGIALEKFGALFFGNGANLGGILQHPGKLTDPSYKRLKAAFESKRKGISKSHETIILEEGMKYEKIGIPPEEGQFLGSRKFQVNEIARWFRLPPHMIGDLERATFSNIEMQDLEFVKYSLMPWLKRGEAELMRKLLTEEEKKTHFIEYNVDGLLRGDIVTRGQYYQIMRTIGTMNANEVRRKENMNDREDADGESYDNPNTSSPGTTIPMALPK